MTYTGLVLRAIATAAFAFTAIWWAVRGFIPGMAVAAFLWGLSLVLSYDSWRRHRRSRQIPSGRK